MRHERGPSTGSSLKPKSCRVTPVFWTQFLSPGCQVVVRGIKKVDQMFVLTMAGYNLTRLRSLGQIRLQGQV